MRPTNLKYDLAGQKIGRLKVISYLKDAKWLCICDCGKSSTPHGHDLVHNNTRSCGCLKLENSGKKPAYQDIDELYIPEPNSGCWLWLRSTDPCGYGRISIKRKLFAAHRFFYEQYKGEIPSGMVICHTCDVPSCVNPDHLRAGTHADNMRDMVEKGRWKPASGYRRLSADAKEKILVALSGSLHVAKVARLFGVSPTAIRKIRDANRALPSCVEALKKMKETI